MKIFSKRAPYCLEYEGSRGASYYVRYRKRGVLLDKVKLAAENREDALEEAEKMILEAKDKARATRSLRVVASTGTVCAPSRGATRERAIVPGGSTASFRDVATKILGEVDRLVAVNKRRPRTLKQYQLHLNTHLIPWFEENYPTFDEFMVDPKAAWLQFCEDRWEVDPEFRIYTHRQIARTVFVRAFDDGLIRKRVKLECPDGETLAGRWVADAEIKALRLAANPVMRLQIDMAADMGMRRWEILRLRKDRILFDRNAIRLTREDCKIKRAREFAIPQSLIGTLRAQVQASGSSPYLFPSPIDSARPVSGHKTAWDTTRRNAEVECRFHDLRHTFITNAILVYGVQIEKVASYCGVSKDVIEKVYLHNRAEFTAEIASKVDRSKSFQHVLSVVAEA